MRERDYVTIVSGLPRSGTSMMMQMLAQGGLPVLADHQRQADGDNPRGYYEFEPVKKTKEDPSWLLAAQGKVVKMVHLLLLDLPLVHRYRVILMRRNLGEVLRSQNTMLANLGKPVGDLPEERIMEVYRAQLARVRRHLTAHGECFQYLEADYNQLIRDPQRTIHELNAFLDGLDIPKMQAAIEPQLYRNRSGGVPQRHGTSLTWPKP